MGAAGRDATSVPKAEASGPQVPTILIAGAGIAGISLALFLGRSGKFRVRLFDRAPVLTASLGAHFGLNGALVCLDLAGLRHVWEPICTPLRHMRTVSKEGRFLTDIAFEDALQGSAFDGRCGLFMRCELQAGLANELPKGVLELGKDVVGVNDIGGKVRVAFADGTGAEGDLLIGTDGINSAVRRLVFPEIKKVYAGQKLWLLVHKERPPVKFRDTFVDLPSEDALTLCMSAGSTGQQIVGVVKHAPMPTPEELARDSTPERFIEVLTKGGAISAGIITEERVRTAERLLHFAVHSMPASVESWSRGRVCLLGDAIHATTPFMGQGANQAVQSAYCLARLLEERGIDKYEEVFQELYRIREPVASRIIALSGKVGRVRIPAKDETCFAGMKRSAFYAVMRWAPNTFARTMSRQWEVQV